MGKTIWKWIKNGWAILSNAVTVVSIPQALGALATSGVLTTLAANFQELSPTYVIILFVGLSVLIAVGWYSVELALTERKAFRPQQKAGEAADQPKAPLIVERDVWVLDAIYRAALGRWERPEIESDSNDPYAMHLGEETISKLAPLAFDELPQLALDGKLPIWAKGMKFSDRWKPVPPEYWDEHHIDWFGFVRDNPEEMRTKSRSLKRGNLLRALMTSRLRVEELWPVSHFPSGHPAAKPAGASDSSKGPDYFAWDQHSILTLLEAACLWAEIDPSSSDRLPAHSPWLSLLKKAVAFNEISPHEPPMGVSMQRFLGAATREIDPTTIPETVRLSRKSLVRFAETKNIRPKFLFPDERM